MSKKDVERAITTAKPSEIDNKQEEVRTGPTPSSSEQRHSFNRALEETNENIKRGIEEAELDLHHHHQNNDIHSIEH